MMGAFDAALAFVLRHEGGLSDDPRDPGGLTKWGISQRAYPDVDVRALTREGAAAIYRRDYWAPLRADEMPPAWALCCFDMAVNQGPRAAARTLQRALGVAQDGRIGPETLGALRRAGGDALADFMATRALRYVSTRGFDVFGRGWLRRCFDAHREALALMAEEGRAHGPET